MKIMNIVKFVGAVASVATAIVVADKMVDKVYEKKLEKVEDETFTDDENIPILEDKDFDDKVNEFLAEEKKIETKKTVTKAVLTLAALACTYELALEKGVVAGAAYFTKIPTTYEDAEQLIVSKDTFGEIMRDVRKAVLF